MLFNYYFCRDTCPPVFRVLVDTEPMERRSLLRTQGETDQQFCARAQTVAYRMWLRSGCKSVRIECVYHVPTPQQDPHFFDDERWMDIAALRNVLDREHAPAEVRIECAKALNRIHGLVRPDAW